ncbi:uncharacterized protein LOC128395698 [Panonychus citri]|uniref:uncharacterized protein LOC128395698 n=1 Tax=Panonychus citri TaxID=50023 RepID=UPI0023071CC7|nr:uncharacterized protein LOC128395698 [Panonychus citri]
MDVITIEIESNIREIERFFLCLDKVSCHVYGLIKTAINEVRERLDCHYQIIKYLWTQDSIRSDIIKIGLNGIGNNSVEKGELIHYLATKDLDELINQFFKTFSKMLHLVENFRRLMRLRVIGGPEADNVEMYRQVDEILMAYG